MKIYYVLLLFTIFNLNGMQKHPSDISLPQTSTNNKFALSPFQNQSSSRFGLKQFIEEVDTRKCKRYTWKNSSILCKTEEY